jgi:hypothetical protein
MQTSIGPQKSKFLDLFPNHHSHSLNPRPTSTMLPPHKRELTPHPPAPTFLLPLSALRSPQLAGTPPAITMTPAPGRRTIAASAFNCMASRSPSEGTLSGLEDEGSGGEAGPTILTADIIVRRNPFQLIFDKMALRQLWCCSMDNISILLD